MYQHPRHPVRVPTFDVRLSDLTNYYFRLYDIRDFTQSLRVPPSQPPNSTSNQAQPVTSPARTPTPSTQTKAATTQLGDEDDDNITAEDLLSALLHIQQSVEDARQRAQLEAAIKQRLQQQRQERQSAVVGMLFAKAIEEQAWMEQERREQEEAKRFLRMMGFVV